MPRSQADFFTEVGQKATFRENYEGTVKRSEFDGMKAQVALVN